MQTEIKKVKLCDYFSAENRVSLDQPDRRESAEIIRDTVWPRVRSPQALLQYFGIATGEASSGCQPLATDEDAGTVSGRPGRTDS